MPTVFTYVYSSFGKMGNRTGTVYLDLKGTLIHYVKTELILFDDMYQGKELLISVSIYTQATENTITLYHLFC